MKRADFVKEFTAGIDSRRFLKFPDMTPAERAASAWSDRQEALKLWRRLSPPDRAAVIIACFKADRAR